MAKKDEPVKEAPKTPEEQVLSETLLAELKKAVETNPTDEVEVIIPNSTDKAMRIPISALFPQSGRPSEKKKQTAKAEPVPATPPPPAAAAPAAETPKPAAEPKTEVKAEPEPAKEPEKKVSRSFFSLFHFPKKEPKAETEPTPAAVVVPAETQLITNEALLKVIDSKIKTISGDEFIMIKMSKQALLILSGVILVLIWTLPWLMSVQKSVFGREKPQNQSVMVAATPAPTPLPQPKIRVRMESDSLDAANKVGALLTAAGYTEVEIVRDTQINTKTVLIVTGDDGAMLKQKLTELFQKDYNVASESASLSEDSDFSASILVGKNALKQ